jgi:hypothetical protein
VLADIPSLRFIQDSACVFAGRAVPGNGRKDVFDGLDKIKEILDRPLKENVVLPKCVVCVDEQGLPYHAKGLESRMTSVSKNQRYSEPGSQLKRGNGSAVANLGEYIRRNLRCCLRPAQPIC